MPKTFSKKPLKQKKSPNIKMLREIISKRTEELKESMRNLKNEINERIKAEKALSDSESEFKSLFTATPAGIGLLFKRKFQKVNDEMCRMFGYTKKELIGSFTRILYENDEEYKRVGKVLYKNMEKNGIGKIETKLRRKNGIVLDVMIYSCPVYANDKKGLNGIVATVFDISVHKYTENALKFKNLILTTQQEVSQDGILIVGEYNEILSYNKKFVEMWDLPEDILSSGKDKILLKYNLNKLKDPEKVIKRVSYLYEHKDKTSNDELNLIDGRVFERYSAPMFGENKKYYGRVWYFRDITGNKNSIEALKKSENEFRTLFETTPTGVIVLKTRKILKVNPELCRMSGYSQEELIGQSARILYVNEEEFILTGKIIYEPMKGKNVTTVETHLKCKNGEILNILIYSSPLDIVTKDISKGIIAIILDITEQKKIEKVLLLSEQKTLNIIKHLPLGMHFYRLEPDGRLIFEGANPSADNILSVDNSTFIGKTIEEAFPPLEKTEIPENYRKVVRENTIWKNEQVNYHEGIIIGVYEVYAFQIEQNRMAVTFIDITERKKTEEALKKSEAEFRNIFETTPTGLAILRDRKFLKLNSEGSKIIGYTAEEVIGKSARMLYESDEEFARVGKEISKALTQNKITTESKFIRKNGEKIDVLMYISPMENFDDNASVSVEMTVALLDITERKRTEQALKESEDEFRSLFEAAPAGAAMLKNRIFLKVNSELCKITGYSMEELRGESIKKIYYSEDEYNKAGIELYSRMSKEGLVIYDTVFKHKNGNPIDILIYACPIDNISKDVSKGIVAAFLDITERKKIEMEKIKLQEQLLQAQKMESIGRLAGGIAHDFNNLLTAIIGNTELALMLTDKNEKLNEMLSIVKQASESAAYLTRQLLAFSRKQIIDPSVINLNKAIKDMQKMLIRVIGENITLRAATQEDLFSIKVDISQIEQIIINLAINARDAMPDGGILSLETANVVLDEAYCLQHAYSTEGEHVMLAISDTGAGMSKEIIEHIFEPFFTTKSMGKGTGLGLATVYGAVKQNNGSIEVYSEPGKGSSFKIYFPRVHEETSVIPEKTDSNNMPRGSETILLVEDNPLVLQFTKGALELLGYNIISASSGEKALEIFDKNKLKINLLMTDVILPGINGQILAETLKQKMPDIKILYCSGYTENAIVAHGVLKQGLHFISKPFSATELAKKIRVILDEKT